MNGECCGSREEGQANDIPATLVVVYYNVTTSFMRTVKTDHCELMSRLFCKGEIFQN